MPEGKSYDQAYIKRRNIQSVLAALDGQKGLSRTDLVGVTGISATSIGRIVGALISTGLLREAFSAPAAGRGRKALQLDARPEGLYTLGIHLNTDCIRMWVMDFGQNLAAALEALAPANLDPAAFASLARDLLRRVPAGVQAAMNRVRAAGVCVSGTVDRATGTVTRSDQMDWTSVPLAEIFSSVLGMPVRVENDVKSCLTGEKARLGIPREEDCAYLFIGQAGMGAAAAVNGHIVRGRDNASGEIDEIPLGNGDTLQTHLLTKHLLARAMREEPRVRGVGDVLSAYRLDVLWARLLVDDFQRHLTLLIRMIEGLLSPNRLILGGETIRDFEWLIRSMPMDHISLGGDFARSCGQGAAILAMREAVLEMLSDELNG